MFGIKKGGLIGGTIWTTLSFVVVSLVYILRISVLTRYLDKADFGLVAIVLFVLGFTNIFADMGVSSSLLSQQKVSQREYSSLYWGSLCLAVGWYIVVSFTSPLFAYFYERRELNYLIPIMGIDLIISSIGRQFAVFKQKEFKFKQLAVIKISSEVTSMIVAILLASHGFGIWSLIVSLMSTTFVNSLLNFIVGFRSHPLIWYFNYKKTKHLYRIGLYQTGSQVLDFISSQIDILILGKLLPMSDMGVYSIVKNLVLRVYSSVNQVVTKVAVPIFAKLKEDMTVFKHKYLTMLSGIVIVNIFFYLIIFIAAKETLILFYGNSYEGYAIILQLLCVWGVFSSVLNCTGLIVIISTGRTDLGFRWTQFRLLLNPFFVVIGAYFGGIVGTAVSQAIYSCVTIFFYRNIVVRHIMPNFSNFDFVRALYKPLLGSMLIAGVFLSVLDFIPLNNIYLVLGGVSSVVCLFFLVFFRKDLLNLVKL